MHLRPLFFILSVVALSCKQKENFVIKSQQKKKAVDRLNERYYLIRTLLTFPKLGVSAPANAYVLSLAPPGDSTTIPHVLRPAFSTHHIADDTLNVPYGTQCNFSLKHTRLFLNAGSELAFKDDRHATHFTGELHVQTGPDEVFDITTGDWHIKIEPDSKLNIMAYENEPCIIIALREGSVIASNDSNISVLNTTDEAIIICKTSQHIIQQHFGYGDAAAWTNGRLSGKGLHLPALFRQLERLYNTHFAPVKYDSVYGNYNIPYRDLTLGKVLELLHQARGVYPTFRGDSIYMVKKE
jgi:hypothetical protein